MPTTSKKFNNVRATRLSLLLTLSLTVGIATAIYSPLDLKQSGASQTPQVDPTASTPVTGGFGQAAATSTLDFSGDAGQDPETGAVDSNSTTPQIVQTTEAPILTTTQAS
jgi:hypothetical protein